MLTARLDVSGVPGQGGYVAKQCPVRPQWDVIRPADPVPVPDAARRRMDQGNEFEAVVFAQLAHLHPAAVVVARGGPDDRSDREARTVAAMHAGAPVIIGGRLPPDPAGRRVGEPDLLVSADGGGYHPVDVKHHGTLTEPPATGARIEARLSTLADPWWHAATVDEAHSAKKHKGDLLQLAHYRRMLEACGHAAPTNRGGIVGTDHVVTWYELEDALWQTPSVSEGRKMRSTMDVYDFEFGFRLDIIATAQRVVTDASVEPLVVPVKIGECTSCPWQHHCHALLEERADISLLPRFGWNARRRFVERGVTTLQELASLDWRTADLCDRNVDLVNLFDALDALDAHAPDTPIGDVIGKRKRGQIASLERAGVRTAADGRSLDRRLAPFSKSGANVGDAIDLARARLADAPAMLRRGVTTIDMARGDVEVDLDMENTEDGVYLWGALVTNRAAAGLVEDGYRAFVTWEVLDPETGDAELAIFEQLMDWIVGLRHALAEAGHSVCVYCFNDKAEAGELRRLAASPGASARRRDEVDALVTSDGWVDLLAVAKDHLVTGRGMGLKKLAPLAGFTWQDDDPGGEQSMHWHDLAVASDDAAQRAANRERLLTYNRNDVEATLALREWLDASGDALPNIEDTDAHHGW